MVMRRKRDQLANPNGNLNSRRASIDIIIKNYAQLGGDPSDTFHKQKLKTKAITPQVVQKSKRRISISEENESVESRLKSIRFRNISISTNNNNNNIQQDTFEGLDLALDNFETSKKPGILKNTGNSENNNNTDNKMAAAYNSRTNKELYAPKLQKSMEINYMTTLMDNLDEYRIAFKRFAHGADKLPLHRLGHLLRYLGLNPTESEVEDLKNEIDEDQNGFIDMNEFVQMVQDQFAGQDNDEELLEILGRF